MASNTCHGTRHVWRVTSDGNKLNTHELSHGHRCHCGNRVIARVDCSQGCSHKRVVSKDEFDRLMEERE
jgi:hypothetical protein